MNEQISEVFYEIMNLAERMGVSMINKLDGCWEVALDAHWWIAVNGHRESQICSTGGVVPGFHCYVEFNGLPAGFVAPNGGMLAAGSAANEDALIEALRKAGAE